MLKALVMSLALGLGFQAQANTINHVATVLNEVVFADATSQFDFKVGDSASYNLKAGFISGTMVMSVKAVEGSLVTLGQDLDLGFMGKQACTVVLDSSTGETKSMVCNGQAQNPPAQGDMEVVEMKEDTVRVPAGSFTCLYLKVLQKSTNNTIQQWANPKLVPVTGMIKTISPSQMGEVNVELTSFKKN